MSEISISDNIELIKALRDKIAKFRDEFSKNEALVRYALIDPFLRAVGWDTEDPEQVKPEYSTEAGRPDYALFANGRKVPTAFVGAKKLFKSEDIDQHITYCIRNGVRFFITSDGSHWEIYDLKRDGKIQDRKIAEWDVDKDNITFIAIQSLIIANFESFGVTPGEPVFGEPKMEQSNIEPKIKEFEPESIESPNVNERKKGNAPLRPVSVTINGKEVNIKKSNEILIKTAEWLILKHKLTNPTRIESGPDRWLINIEPVHKNKNNKFANPYKLSNGLYLETNYGSRRIEQLAKSLMKHFGYSDDSISVRWRE